MQAGGGPIQPDPALGHAANFLYMLTGERPSALATRAFDVALMLHADHELNASTFAARVAAATLTDIHSAIVGGDRHAEGAAARRRERRRHAAADRDRPGRAARARRRGDPRRSWRKKMKIPGFGHRVYHTEDPRATHLRQMSKELGERAGNTRWFEMSQRIETLVKAREEAESERRLLLGVDLLHARHSDRSVHADLRGQPHLGLDGALPRAVREQPPDPPAHRLHRPAVSADVPAARSALSDAELTPMELDDRVIGSIRLQPGNRNCLSISR